MKRLLAELDEYIRKQDFHNREPCGEEADAPWRAISHVAGAKDLAAGPLLFPG